MNVSRRWFIGGAAAFGAFGGARVFAANGFSAGGKPNLTFGIISDVHLSRMAGDPEKDIVANCANFLKTLKAFDAAGVDAVVIAGDLINDGVIPQLEQFALVWRSVFPNDRASDGRHVEKLFVTGNHDMRFHNHPRIKKKYPDEKDRFARSISFDPNAAWQKCFHEAYQPVSIREIKGYSFIARQYGEKGVGAFLAAEKTRLDPSKPFFFVQHQHLKDTCYGPAAWGRDDGKDSTDVLAKFPNAVAFSGHSHYSLTDEQSVWQGAFTSIGASSLNYVCAHYGYENGENPKLKRTEEMPMFVGRTKQGMLMRVYDDRMVLERRDFVARDNPKLGPDWTIPLPFAEPAPFDFTRRGGVFPVPEFPEGAVVTVRRADGQNRMKEAHQQVTVEFPAATAGKGRVFDYEVTVSAAGRAVLTRRVLSPTFDNAPSKDGGVAQCVFAASEIPPDATFSVAPRNSFGRAGRVLARRG